MRTTDEITYAFREFNRDKPAEAIIEALNHAITTSTGLTNPKVTDVRFDDFGDAWIGSDDEPPAPTIRVTVAGS